MRTAVKLPSHHGNHTEASFSQTTCSIRPEVRSSVTLAPTLALTAATPIAINTNFVTPVGVAKALRPPAHSLTTKLAANASNALPAAVAAAAGVRPDQSAFAR